MMEQRLLTAEKLSAFAAWLGAPADLDGIWAGWEPVLFNQTHDLASGVMTSTATSMRTMDSGSYEFASAGLKPSSTGGGRHCSDNTQGPGAPVVVFNTLGWTRSDLAFGDAGCGAGGGGGIPSSRFRWCAGRRDRRVDLVTPTVV